MTHSSVHCAHCVDADCVAVVGREILPSCCATRTVFVAALVDNMQAKICHVAVCVCCSLQKKLDLAMKL